MAADLSHAVSNGLLVTGTANDGGVLLGDLDLAGRAQQLHGCILQLIAQVAADDGTAGQDSDILQHLLTAIAEAGSLDGNDIQAAAQTVDDQVGQGIALYIFSNDQQLTAGLDDLLQQRNDVLEDADLLVGNQDGAIVVDGLHLLGVGDHVGGHVAAVELHTFDDLGVGLGSGLILFDGDNAIGSDLLHCVSDQLADLSVTGRDSANTGDVLAAVDLLAVLLNGGNSGGDSLLHAALDVHGVGTGGNVLHALGDKSLGQNGGGGGAVTSCIVGLGGDFANELCAHVLELILQFDFLGDGNAIVGDERAAELLAQHHVAALGAQGDLNGIGQLVDACAKCFTGVLALFDLFSHKESLLLYQNGKV